MSEPKYPYWYYAGHTTAPVDIPGKGPIVLTPRTRFFAPQSSVAHLLGTVPPLVKRLPDPPSALPVPEAPKAEAPKQAQIKSQAVAPPVQEVVSPARAQEDVVASVSAVEGEPSEAGAGDNVPEESESRSARRRRRDRGE